MYFCAITFWHPGWGFRYVALDASLGDGIPESDVRNVWRTSES